MCRPFNIRIPSSILPIKLMASSQCVKGVFEKLKKGIMRSGEATLPKAVSPMTACVLSMFRQVLL